MKFDYFWILLEHINVIWHYHFVEKETETDSWDLLDPKR
jgi:hypothetical protein